MVITRMILAALVVASPTACGTVPSPSVSTIVTATPQPHSNASVVPSPPALIQQSEPALPVAREETAAAATASALYVIGGYDAAGLSRADVFAFDGQRWRAAPSLPIGLNHPAADAIESDVYVSGGYRGAIATARAFVLPQGAVNWRELPPMHHARAAHTLLALGGRLYAIGGRTGAGEVRIPEVFDPAAGSWTDLPPMPSPRDHVSGFALNGLGCAAGGRTPATTFAVDCYNPALATWRSFPALPRPTSGAGGGVLDGVPVVAGGELATETALAPTVFLFRGTTWETMPMLSPRHGFALALWGGRLWACGGGNAPGLHPVPTCTSIHP